MVDFIKRNIRSVVGAGLALVILVVLLCWHFFPRDNSVDEFRNAISQAQAPILIEGLPHPIDDGAIAGTERRTKAVLQMHGDYFYQERLGLKDSDVARLSNILCSHKTYQPAGSQQGSKMCGGFHADYALEWKVGTDQYLAIICLKCEEIKLIGPSISAKHDITKAANDELKKILRPYRKNRPPLAYEY